MRHYDEPSPAYELARATAAHAAYPTPFNAERLRRARWVILCQSARLQATHAYVFRHAQASPYEALEVWARCRAAGL